MRCKECDTDNPAPIREPIYAWTSSPCDATAVVPLMVRWACWKCSRYHNDDGTLYQGRN
jgi:hypothetical protein